MQKFSYLERRNTVRDFVSAYVLMCTENVGRDSFWRVYSKHRERWKTAESVRFG